MRVLLGMVVVGVIGAGVYAGSCPMSQCGTKCASSAAKKTAAMKPAVHAVGMIDTATLETLMRSGADMVILDARSGKYDDGRRIPGAKSLSASKAAEMAAKLIPTKSSLVVTYCSNVNCPASARLAEALGKLGYTNVLEYPKGIAGWVEAGKTVEKAGQADGEKATS